MVYGSPAIPTGRVMETQETLRRAEVFLGLDDSELNKIAALPSCREETYQPGELVLSARDPAKYVYVLKEGEVDVVTEVPAKSEPGVAKVVVDKVTRGDVFGWSALVKPHSYVMSAIAKKPSKVLVISGAELAVLLDENHTIGYKVFQGLSKVIGARLRYLEQALIRGKRWPLFAKGKSR